MGRHDWIGEMGLILGGTPLGCDTGWDTSWGHDWIREMGLICGLMGLIYGDTSWGHTTGSGRWDWFVGARHWVWHWLYHVMGARDWIREMGLICRGTPWGATLVGCEWWDWFMGVFHGGAQLDRGDGIDLWRRTMGRITLDWSGWGNWFMRTRHEGDTGWIGAMGMIHRGVSNDKVQHGCWM